MNGCSCCKQKRSNVKLPLESLRIVRKDDINHISVENYSLTTALNVSLVKSLRAETPRNRGIPCVPPAPSPSNAGNPAISSLSILWLLPQFALIAAAEAFIYPVSWGSRILGITASLKTANSGI